MPVTSKSGGIQQRLLNHGTFDTFDPFDPHHTKEILWHF